MDISGTNIKHITMFDRQYTPEKQAEGLAISQAIDTGIVISVVSFLSVLHRGRHSSFLCLRGVCDARWKSLQICKRRKPDGY